MNASAASIRFIHNALAHIPNTHTITRNKQIQKHIHKRQIHHSRRAVALQPERRAQPRMPPLARITSMDSTSDTATVCVMVVLLLRLVLRTHAVEIAVWIILAGVTHRPKELVRTEFVLAACLDWKRLRRYDGCKVVECRGMDPIPDLLRQEDEEHLGDDTEEKVRVENIHCCMRGVSRISQFMKGRTETEAPQGTTQQQQQR